MASGILFLTYGLMQVPSAAAGVHFGMRWWFGFIIVAWGVVATCTSLVNTAGQVRRAFFWGGGGAIRLEHLQPAADAAGGGVRRAGGG
jgi:hypothetical protein